MINEDHPKKLLILESVNKLKNSWNTLNKEIDNFQAKISKQLTIQECLLDASDISAWISEKELDLMDIVISTKVRVDFAYIYDSSIH